MVDAIKGEVAEDKDHQDDQLEKDAKLNHHTKKAGKFDIVATAIVLLVAGYELWYYGYYIALAFACYQLSKRSDIQER